MAFEFKFPDVGEGITEGELLTWKVGEGDSVQEDDTLAEVETDKAVVEIPSPRTGTIAKLHAEEGDLIEVGQVIVTIDENGSGASARQEEPAEAPAAARGPEPASGEARPAPAEEVVPPSPPSPQPVAAEPGAPERPERHEEAVAEEAEEFYTGSVVGRLEEAPEEEPETGRRPAAASTGGPAARDSTGGAERAAAQGKVLAMPSVRAFAKEMGVDINGIQGTGPGGRVLRRDVEDYAEAAAYGRETVRAPSIQPEEREGAEAWMGGRIEEDGHGVIERVGFRGVRRRMAQRMAESLAKQAQVTTMDEADVSILKRIREKERSLAAERGIRLTYLAFVIKACAAALQRFPRLNAVLEEGCDEFILKRYYNIGIAIDTKAGLVVPNIKNADGMSIFEIAEAIVDLVERAQDRKLDLSELNGGTFTITNYGAIGGISATPVANYPEVAILGMGRIRELPVVVGGEIRVRQMLPLSLTFDHQLIDGAEASRFLNLVVSYLEDPDLLLLESA